MNAAEQKDSIAMWFEVNPATVAQQETRRFEIFMTGEEYDGSVQRTYLATVVLDTLLMLNGFPGRGLVLHIFERNELDEETT